MANMYPDLSDKSAMAMAIAERNKSNGMDDTRVMGKGSPTVVGNSSQVDSCLTGRTAVVSKDHAGRSGM